MKIVICALSIITAGALFAAVELFGFVPAAVGTAVIGEKGLGNQTVVVMPKTMSPDQGRLMEVAYAIAKADGHKQPELIQAVLLQESGAGAVSSFRVSNPGPDAYFGAMQLKLAAAKDVLLRFPALFTKYNIHTKTDDEIKANLILNDKFNIEVGSKYLLILHDQYGFTGRELMNAYNRGPGGVKSVGADFHYAISAEAKLASYKAR